MLVDKSQMINASCASVHLPHPTLAQMLRQWSMKTTKKITTLIYNQVTAFFSLLTLAAAAAALILLLFS